MRPVWGIPEGKLSGQGCLSAGPWAGRVYHACGNKQGAGLAASFNLPVHMVEVCPLVAQKGVDPGSMRKLDHHGHMLWNTEYIRGLIHYAIVGDARKKNPEKSVRESH